MSDEVARYKLAVEQEFEARKSDAEKVFEDHAVVAAEAIVNLAESADSANVRLKANTYILDRTIFKDDAEESDLVKFLQSVKAPTQEG
jgi:hypothetical protein